MPPGSLSIAGKSWSSFFSWVASVRSPGYTTQLHSMVRAEVCTDDQIYFKTFVLHQASGHWLRVAIWCLFPSYTPGNLISANTWQSCILSFGIFYFYFLETLSSRQFKYLKNTEKWMNDPHIKLELHQRMCRADNRCYFQTWTYWTYKQPQDPRSTVHWCSKSLLQGHQPRMRSYGQKPCVMTRC